MYIIRSIFKNIIYYVPSLITFIKSNKGMYGIIILSLLIKNEHISMFPFRNHENGAILEYANIRHNIQVRDEDSEGGFPWKRPR